MRQKTVCQKN